MADWTSINVNSLLPGEPFTSALALALEENPRAIAEGKAAATRMASIGFDWRFLRLGSQSGGGSADDVIGSVYDVGELDDWKVMLLGVYEVTSFNVSQTNSILFQASTDNSTWTTIRTIVTATNTTNSIDYSDMVEFGTNYRYFRMLYDPNTSGSYSTSRANIIITGRTP